MTISITGVIINIVMIIIIIIIIVAGVTYNRDLKDCENKQSPFCYTIQCPCDTQQDAPCFGYAKMPAQKTGQWYCSNAVNSIVDNNGNVV